MDAHLGAGKAGGIPRQRQRAARRQQRLPHRQRIGEQIRQLAVMLNAVGQIGYDQVWLEAVQQRDRLLGIATRQGAPLYLVCVFLANGKRPALPQAFQPLFILAMADALFAQELGQKCGCGLHILRILLHARRIRSQHQRREERGAAARQRIKHTQRRPGPIRQIAAELGDVAQLLGEQFVRLAAVALRYQQIGRQRGRVSGLAGLQKRTIQPRQCFVIDKNALSVASVPNSYRCSGVGSSARARCR